MSADVDEIAELLLKLIKIYTPSGRESELHDVLSEIVEEFGYEERSVDEVGNFIASYGNGIPILLASHIDTVPGKLDAYFDGERVYGRGAVDAKGPLLSYILAGAIAMEKVEGLKIYVAGLVREEVDGLGARHLIGSGFKADHILIGEPTNLGVAIAYRGSVSCRISAKARGGHSSAPYVGESALDEILDFLMRVRERYGGSSYDEITSAITVLRAGDWPGNLPEEASAHLNIRFPKPHEPDELIAELKALSKNYDVELDIVDSTPPVEVSINSPIVRAMIRGCLRNGIKPRIVKKTGTSDMNLLAKITKSIAAFGPGDSKLAHTRSEFINVKDLLKASEIIASALIELSRRISH